MEETGIIISGFGGQGTLFAGSLLCNAAVIEGKSTTWIPSYGAEMRGGVANCSVKISDEEISSPLIDKADAVFALNLPSKIKFEKRVKKGGLLLLNTSLIEEKVVRDDIECLLLPLNDMAESLGKYGFLNVIAVGAYVAKTGVLSLDSVKAAIEQMIPEKRKDMIPYNIASLELGAEYLKEKV